jgi:hypothetical protein
MDGIRLQNADENRLSRLTVSVNAATIARNTATENGDLGMEAVAGVTDGGGNKASSNGNAAQCTGVVCS